MKSMKILALLTTTATLAACGSSSDKDYAYLRVLHASPDAPNVDVLINGQAVLTNVSFQQGSGYLKVRDGAKNVALRVSGSDTIALEQSFNLAKNNFYSVIAKNNVSELALKALNDTDRRSNNSNDVTVVHASPIAGNVDIFVTAPLADLTTSTLGDVPFKADATLPNIESGEYQVRITAANDANNDVVYDSGTITINNDVTVVAVNSNKGAAPVSLLIWNESATPVIPLLDNSAEVRIVHAVDAVDVDVFAAGEPLLTGFSYRDVENYLKVAAGDLDVAIAPAGQGISSALTTLSGTLSLERGESYTVIAAGDVNDLPNTQLIILSDQRETALAESGLVRLVHASSAPAADPVDIFVYQQNGTQPTTPNFAGVTLGQDMGYVELPSATYTVDIAAGDTTTAAVPGTDAVPVVNGSIQTAIAIGNASGLSALLLDDKRPTAVQ